MSTPKQIFQTSSKSRWRAVQWSSGLLATILILLFPIVLYSLLKDTKPVLPQLDGVAGKGRHSHPPIIPRSLTTADLKKYRGFDAYLTARKKIEQFQENNQPARLSEIRAAFYVDWDPQSFYSLQQHISKLNTVVPEWFFIDPTTDTLQPQIDTLALQLMKKNKLCILPLLNNINQSKEDGEFDGSILHRILHNPAKKERLIRDIVKYIRQYQLQGINIDFEEFNEAGDEPIIAFQKELYEKLHALELLVTQDIMAGNTDFNVKKLAAYNDYLFLMAYDEHFTASTPGPVSSQQWIEKVLDETARELPSNKLILGIAGYGYDWPKNEDASTVTYQQALAIAKQHKAPIDFDNNNYNNRYSYTDAEGTAHEVWFADAATNFNTIRFADEYGTAGTALWRLGSEDERIWQFYNRSLTNKSLLQQPINFSDLEKASPLFEHPDYLGDGEILNVLTKPDTGKIRIEGDSVENLIAEQRYLQLPSGYVIKKYGNVNHQVILTFDDGPDPSYTPQILDILKKEKVPATFFVVGMEAENNLPLLKRIFQEGHEIGNHSFTHPNIATVSSERATAELESTRLLIEAVTGHSTVLFRAPYNADAEPSTEAELRPIALSKQKNYYTVGESIDPNDWETGITADSIYLKVIQQYEANPGKGIILLHDAGGNRQATVDALPRIIHYFKNKQVAFTTVANLLHTPKETIMPPVHGKLLQINGQIAGFGYHLEKGITLAFWAAIILGMVRILIMAILAIIQKLKTAIYQPVQQLELGNPAPVSILVPAYNEELTAVKTLENLLQQDYKDFEIIFIDDGSTDHSFQTVQSAFSKDKRVKIYTKPNGGKASALNYGISQTNNDYIVCIDADTQLKSDAITQLMKCFINQLPGKPAIGAVAGNVKVGNKTTILTKWQSIEYTTAQNFDRRAFDLINGITVVPGAIGAFKKDAVQKAGGFTSDTLAEDCDLTIRILRSGYRVVNCTEAIAVTEAPETIHQFMKQRFRWCYGIMQSFWKNKDACFNPRFKSLGMISLPNILLFQILLPLLAPLADLMLVISLFYNRHNLESIHKIITYYLLFLLVDILVSAIAFAFEKEKPGKLFWIIPQRFIYRQLMYIILFKSLKKAIKGESQTWGVLKRTGHVKPAINTVVT
ncbi:polysaccharide deacetylase family protein [Flavihumibacter sp. CACIAM 22H1]|uniref:polysaccharide deacetylase family protein n=1 Tax=Flavihumibacter sp. CACIAM 22H1 TaxID=1812911 RepID=UPI0007A89F42|nr:polysaccharide deacetylase family protein [Flavihumibacter sp. CACIAM 22H1]KYP15186.1 MAG: glycosyl transferase family 2 [Flavihumibacter sp. CACIAM 22H1]